MEILAIGHIILIVVAMGSLLLQNYPRTTTLGWIVAFVVVPYIAVGIYFFFNVTIFTKSKMGACLDKNLDLIPSTARVIVNNLFTFPKKVDSYVVLTEREFITSLEKAIIEAKKSISIATFIFSGKTSEHILTLLDDAYTRGIKVDLIVDYVGSGFLNPFNKVVRRIKRTPYARVYKKRNIFYINHRLHSKIAIVDDAIAWVGSHNIWDRADSHVMRNAFSNVTIQITGDIVEQTKEYFSTFNTEYKPSYSNKVTKKQIVDFNEKSTGSFIYSDSYKTNGQVNSVLFDTLLQAKKRCVIVNPYFAPPATMIDVLNLLILRGVRVEILVPKKLNNIFTPLADLYLSYLNSLGALIYRTDTVFDHSKFFVIDDDISIIGSYNTDWRSAYTNLECYYKLYSKAIAKDLIGVYDAKLCNAEKYTTVKLSRVRRAIAHIQSSLISIF